MNQCPLDAGIVVLEEALRFTLKTAFQRKGAEEKPEGHRGREKLWHELPGESRSLSSSAPLR
jgi:hypothetical protein